MRRVPHGWGDETGPGPYTAYALGYLFVAMAVVMFASGHAPAALMALVVAAYVGWNARQMERNE